MSNDAKSPLKQDFDLINELAYSPDFWKSKAESYYISAKILDFTSKRPIPDEMQIEHHYLVGKDLVSPDMILVVHYLMGISLELLLKAQHIKCGNDFKELKTHNLIELSRGVKISLNDEEGWMFQFLSEVIYDYGRYPNVSKTEKKEVGLYDRMKSERNPFFEIRYQNFVSMGAYEESYKKILRIYDATSYENWKMPKDPK